MSDRLPGTSYDNPIRYRGYRVHLGDLAYRECQYVFAHEDYDGAPVHSGDGPADNRAGYGPTVEDCKSQIDEIEDDR